MRRLAFFFSLVLLLIPLSTSAQSLPPVDPSQVTGDILIAGSPVLVPVSENIVTLFGLNGYRGNISVEATNSDDGLMRLCNGEVDIALADRQISPQELNACSANGRPPLAFRVATSAVIVATNRLNSFLDNVSSTELQAIYGTSQNWSEIRSSWPQEPIARYGTGTSSNEFHLFATVVFGGDLTQLSTALGAQFNDDVNISLGRVAESPNAIGFFDAIFALDNSSLIRGVTIDGIEPTFNNVSDGLYPLSRPLIVYSTSTTFNEKPQVRSFMNYYLTNIENEAAVVSLFPAPSSAITTAINTWIGSGGQIVQPTATSAVPLPETTENPFTVATEPPIEGTEEVLAPPPDVFPPEVQSILRNARLDLELVATERSGVQRPEGWSGALDVNNPQLPIFIRLDLELLAASVYGIDTRPPDWFGAINSTSMAIARDIRHDLELIADATFFAGTRPTGWAGDNPVYRCNRQTQALVLLLESNGLYSVTINPLDTNFCGLLSLDVALYTEVNLLNPNVEFGADGVETPRDAQIDTNFAVAFYDVNARQRAGIIPFDAQVSPVARSYNGFSNMTLVEGDGFLVFIEWQNMNIEAAEFQVLSNIEGRTFETSCTANWCQPK